MKRGPVIRSGFARHRPGDMLGPYTPDQLRPLIVDRQDYGSGNQMNNITVKFVGPSREPVMNARIFPDCEIEWRSQLGDDEPR
jgi:hypothetical protein